MLTYTTQHIILTSSIYNNIIPYTIHYTLCSIYRTHTHPILSYTIHYTHRSQNNFVLSDPSLPDNPIVYCSEGFCKLTGYKRQFVLGRNCRFLQVYIVVVCSMCVHGVYGAIQYVILHTNGHVLVYVSILTNLPYMYTILNALY